MTAYTFSDRYFQPTGLSDRFTAEQRRPKSNSSAFGDFLSPSWQQEIGKTFLEQNHKRILGWNKLLNKSGYIK